MNPNKINLSLAVILLLATMPGCSAVSGESEDAATHSPSADTHSELPASQFLILGKYRRLETHTAHGITFSYYQIPGSLSREELIRVAQEIHLREPVAQLILIDDDSRLADYITYAQEIGNGNQNAVLPKEWAETHIIGNVQKYLSGKWMLCAGKDYQEIAELK